MDVLSYDGRLSAFAPMNSYSNLHDKCILIMQDILSSMVDVNYSIQEDVTRLKEIIRLIDEINMTEALIPSVMQCMISFFNVTFLNHSFDRSILKDDLVPFISDKIKPWISIVDENAVSRAWHLTYYHLLFKAIDLRISNLNAIITNFPISRHSITDIRDALGMLKNRSNDFLHGQLITECEKRLTSPEFYYNLGIAEGISTLHTLMLLLHSFNILSDIGFPSDKIQLAFSEIFLFLKRYFRWLIISSDIKTIPAIVELLMNTSINYLLNIETAEEDITSMAFHTLLQSYNFVCSFPRLLVGDCCRSKLVFSETMQQSISTQLLISASLLVSVKKESKRSINDILTRMSILNLLLLNSKHTEPNEGTSSSAFTFLFSACEIMIADLYIRLHSDDHSARFKLNCQSFWIGSTEISFFKLNAAIWQNVKPSYSHASCFQFTSKDLNDKDFRNQRFISELIRLFPGLFEHKINPGMYLQWSLTIGIMDLSISSVMFNNVPFLAAIFILLANKNSILTLADGKPIFTRDDPCEYLSEKYLNTANSSDYELWRSAYAFWSSF